MNYKNITTLALFVFWGVLQISALSQEQKHESKFVFRSEQEARTELASPSSSFSPSNYDIYARSQAISRCVNQSANPLNILHSLSSQYDYYLIAFGGATNATGFPWLIPAKKSCLPDLQWQIAISEANISGDPIMLKVSLKNVSPKPVKFGDLTVLHGFYLASINLVKLQETPIPVKMTKEGIKYFYYGWSTRRLLVYSIFIDAGETYDLRFPGEFDLAKYYDLSEPGEYELTFYTRRFLDDNGEPAVDQELEYPRKATVRFTVLPECEISESSVK